MNTTQIRQSALGKTILRYHPDGESVLEELREVVEKVGIYIDGSNPRGVDLDVKIPAYAFYFVDAPQGHDYWRDVTDDLYNAMEEVA